jgi:hypothetical protein
MNSEPGSPMTLGKAAGTGLRLLCRALIAAIRSNPIPPRWLLGMAARDGGETPVRDWRVRLVCPRCGRRQVDMVATGTLDFGETRSSEV